MRSYITFIAIFSTIIFLASSLPIPAYALSPSQVFEKIKDSVLVVKTYDTNGNMISQGSGVLIASNQVATNCHVLEGGASYQLGHDNKFVPATLTSEDLSKDICLLTTKSTNAIPVQIGKTSALKIGDSVYAVGAPQGLELSLSAGIVAQLRGGPPPLIQTTAAISPGSSGGGLFDEEGRLVGLTTLYLEGGQSLNFAMPVEWIETVQKNHEKTGEQNRTEWLKRTIVFETSNDWEGLRKWSLKWIKAQPSSAEAWCCLGNAYLNLNKNDYAIEAYHQALRLNSRLTIALSNLGNAYSNVDLEVKAIEAYQKALHINPEDVLTWINLGKSYDKINRHNEAIEAFSEALKLDPKHEDAWNSLGSAYFSQNRPLAAIEAYKEALQLNPQLSIAWYNLGCAYGKLKRHDDEIEAYRQALQIDPEHTSSWNNLAIAYTLSGNRTAALNAVKELRQINPAMANKLFNLIVPR